MENLRKISSRPKSIFREANTVRIYMESGTVVESTPEEAEATLERLERRLKLASLPNRRKDLKLRIDAYRKALQNPA
ncbi:hypothetical protein [Stappia sp. ES.058]|uniref:hypothetical protein n=1 Tax=Stappia sp. ES.058 TaxID=1881061 RepID=UPI0012FDDCF7|nr:hypothetical protein [Stappia sp. ES.058]